MAASGWLPNNSANIRLRSADLGDVAPPARFDDLRSRHSVVLMGLVDTDSVSQLDDVVELLDTAETHARLGSWVAVMLAYEAGAAFDAAFPRRSPPPGVRLAWFAAFSSCERVEPVTRPSAWATPMRVQRRGGSEWFMAGVTNCRHMIEQGSTYQVNPTDRFDGVLADAPFELYRAMATAQGGAFNAYLDLGDLVVVSASPELFLHVDNDHVTARPMKGTARRRPRPADDQRTGEDLIESDKDRAENVMIVDLMRNDLSRLAPYGGVSVPSLNASVVQVAVHAEHARSTLLLPFRGVRPHLAHLHVLQCSTMTQSAHFAIRIEPELLANLTAIALDQDRSVGYIIRAACLRYVSQCQSASSSVPADYPIPPTAKATNPLGVKN